VQDKKESCGEEEEHGLEAHKEGSSYLRKELSDDQMTMEINPRKEKKKTAKK